MGLTYRQVLERYDRAKAFGYKGSVPEFANEMNSNTGTDLFNEGYRDGGWTRFSTRVDQTLGPGGALPIGAVTGVLGAGVGALFGHADAGRTVGEGLPRSLMQAAPLFIPGAGEGYGLALAAGATGAAFGGQTYADTGSGKAAVLSGLTAAALPAVGKFAGAMGARAFGAKPLIGEVTGMGEAMGLGDAGTAFNRVMPATAGEQFGQFAGSQLGQIGLQEASGYAQQKTLNPDQPYDFMSPEMLIGQIPFTVLDAVHTVKTPVIPKGIQKALVKPVPIKVAEPVKEYVPPVVTSDEVKLTLAQGLTEYSENPTPEKLAAIFASVANPKAVEEAKAAPVVEPPKPITVTGYARKSDGNDWKLLVEGHDAPEGAVRFPDHNTVWVKGLEPTSYDLVTGQATFQGLPEQFDPRVTHPLTRPEPALDPIANPDLVQRTEGDPTQPLPEAQKLGQLELPKGPEVDPATQFVKPPSDVEETLKGVGVDTTKITRGGLPAVIKVSDQIDKAKAKVDEAKIKETKVQPMVLKLQELLTKKENLEALLKEMRRPTQESDSLILDSAIISANAQIQDHARAELSAVIKQAEALVQKLGTKGPHKTGEGGDVRGPELIDPATKKPFKFTTEADAQTIAKLYNESKPADIPHRPHDKGYAKPTKAELASGDFTTLEDGTQRGKHRGWSLRQVLNKTTSLDESVVGNITGKHDSIADTSAPQPDAEPVAEPIKAAPDVRIKTLASLRDEVARSAVDAFARVTGTDTVEALGLLREAKDILNDLQTKKRSFEDLDPDEQKLLGRVSVGLYDVTGRRANFTLGSKVPYDKAFVNETGLLDPVRGLRNGLEWFVKNAKSYGVGRMGEMVEGMLSALPDLDKVIFSHPEHPEWDAENGWYFKKDQGVSSRINTPDLPINREDAMTWMFRLVHETAHFLGEDMLTRNDPQAQALRETLKKVRQLVEDSPLLPKKVRELIKTARKDDHYNTFFRGAEKDKAAGMELWYKLASKKLVDEHSAVIYGALSEEELLAQTFGSPEMIAILRGTEMPAERQTILQYFSKAWNRLFGKGQTSDSALAEILQKVDKYVNLDRESYNGRKYQRDMLVAQGVRGDALATRLKTLESMFGTGSLEESLNGLDWEQFNDILSTGMDYQELSPKVRTALLEGKPEDVFKSVYSLPIDQLTSAEASHYRAFEDVAILQNTIQEIKNKNITGSIPDGLEQNLRDARVKLHRMRQALNKQANALRYAQQLDNFTTDGAQKLFSDILQGRPLPAPPDPLPLETLTPVQELLNLKRENAEAQLEGKGAFSGPLGWLGKQLGLQQFMARMHPQVKDVINHLFDNQSSATLRANKLNIAFGFDPVAKGPTKTRNASLRWVNETPKATEAFSNIRRWQNVQEAEGKHVSLKDPVPAKILAQFSNDPKKGRQSDRESIITMLEAAHTRHQMATNQVWPEFFREYNNELTATVIAMGETGILPQQARQLSEKLYTALQQLQDPAQSAAGVLAFQELSSSMQPATLARAVQHAQGMQQSTDVFLNRMKQRPNYAPEQRYDKFHLRMVGLGGDVIYTSHKTEKEALAFRDKKVKEGYTFLDFIPKEDANAPGRGVSADVMDWIGEYDRQTMEKMTQMFSDQPELLEQILPLAQRQSMLQAGLDSFKPVPGSAIRKFVGGREEINMVENENAFYTKSNNWMRHKMTRAQSTLDLLHPDLLANRELTKYSKDLVEQYLTPDNPLVQKIVRGTYFYKLGLDFGQGLIEATQSLTTGMTALVGETGAIGDSANLTQKAIRAIAKHRLTKKWDNPDHHWLIEQAKLKGESGTSMWNEVYDPDKETMNELNFNQGNRLQRAAHTMDYAAKKWSKMFTMFNDDIGLVTGFDLGRSKGMSKEEAYTYAVDLKRRGYFTQGKAGRAQGLWSAKTKAIPQLITSLQNYSLGWFGLMADMYHTGFKGGPPGTTEVQRQAARKGFVYALAAQAVFAGALGLPGVGQGLALFEQSTGVDLKGKLRATLTNLFGEDGQDGGLMTSIALRGLTSGITPFDPSSRMSVSIPFVGVDSYKGFDLKNLAGAPLTTASDMVQGLLATARGDRQGFEKLMPNVLKRPFQLWADEGDVRDKRGGLLYQLSPTEQAMMALGIPSSRIQNAKDIALAADKVSQQALEERQAFADSVAKLMRVGDVNSARQRLAEYAAANPNADMQAMARNVVNRVQAQSIPYDVRRALSPGADLQGLAPNLASTEASRRELKSRMSAGLGLKPSSYHQAVDAERLDALQSANPYQGLPQLRGQLQHSRPHPLSFLQGSPYQ